MQIGIQVSSLRPVLKTEEQVYEAFRRMKEMGCDTVQLQWIDFSVPVESIVQAMKDNGIRSVSTQDFFETVLEHRDYFIRLNQQSGGEWVCVSRIPERYRSREGLEQYAQELLALETELSAKGLKLCFHPTSPDYQCVEGVEPLAFLMERLPERIALCLDLYHLNRSGKSMAETIRRYAGRICMVHFKESRKNADGTEQLVPVGQGDTDWTGVIDACREVGVPYAFVEQEQWDRDPFACLAEALDWLRRGSEG